MVTLLLMVVFGGIGHIWGGVIGAIIVTIIDDLTRDYYQYRMVMFGSVIVLTVMFMPRGIGGIIDDFLVRRRFKAIRKRRADTARSKRRDLPMLLEVKNLTKRFGGMTRRLEGRPRGASRARCAASSDRTARARARSST